MTVERPPVLVLDAQTRQGLAICRALGRAGYPVGAAATAADALCRSSRYVSRFHHVADGLAWLERLTHEHGYALIVSAEDPTIALLRANPPHVPTVPLARGGLERLVDKVELGKIAGAAGVRYPATLPLEGDKQASEALAALGAPVFVKALCSAAVVDGRVRHRSGARVARDVDELERAAAWVRAVGLAVIVQERVRREDKINVTIVRRDNHCEVRFPYRVLRDIPLTGGLAVTLETIPADHGLGAEAVSQLDRVCHQADYQGVANGEFCVTPAGQLVLIEVNTRPWGSLWFAEQLGQQVMERCLRQALHQPPLPPAPPAPANRRFHNLAGELKWARLHQRKLQPLRQIATSLHPRDIYEYLDPTDPLPPLKHAAAALGRWLPRVRRNAAGRD